MKCCQYSPASVSACDFVYPITILIIVRIFITSTGVVCHVYQEYVTSNLSDITLTASYLHPQHTSICCVICLTCLLGYISLWSDSYFCLIFGLLSIVWQDFTVVITSVDDKVRLALVA